MTGGHKALLDAASQRNSAGSALLCRLAPAKGTGLCRLFLGAVVYTWIEEGSGLQRTWLCSYPFCADINVAEE